MAALAFLASGASFRARDGSETKHERKLSVPVVFFNREKDANGGPAALAGAGGVEKSSQFVCLKPWIGLIIWLSKV
jgi:hypothetical protein